MFYSCRLPEAQEIILSQVFCEGRFPTINDGYRRLADSPDTPPAAGTAELPSSPEDRFLLRLKTALTQLPRFLRSA